jgi:alpha-ribazole phosphatase
MDRGAVTKIWLVRHTSVDVPPGTCYGHIDVPLRDSFESEAETLREQLDGMNFDAVWSSPLSRCTRLAAACGYPDARLDDRLRELHFGKWEGRCFDDIRDPQLQLWYDDYLHARPTGGETFDELCARVAEFLDEVPSGEHVLVFTHGGTIVAAAIQTGLFTLEEAFAHIPLHGSVTKIELRR